MPRPELCLQLSSGLWGKFGSHVCFSPQGSRWALDSQSWAHRAGPWPVDVTVQHLLTLDKDDGGRKSCWGLSQRTVGTGPEGGVRRKTPAAGVPNGSPGTARQTPWVQAPRSATDSRLASWATVGASLDTCAFLASCLAQGPPQ